VTHRKYLLFLNLQCQINATMGSRPGTQARLRERLHGIHKSFQDNRLRNYRALAILLADAPEFFPGLTQATVLRVLTLCLCHFSR
jgi:hypothetical protein